MLFMVSGLFSKMWWKVLLMVLLLGSVLAFPTSEGDEMLDSEDDDYDGDEMLDSEEDDYDLMNDTTEGDADETGRLNDVIDYNLSEIRKRRSLKNDTTDGDADADETSMHYSEDGSDWEEYDDDYSDDKKDVDHDATETQFRRPRPVFRAPQAPQPDPAGPFDPPSRRRVAFSVRKVQGRRSAQTTLRFQDVLTNTGGGWQDSRFRVPRSGTYFFTFHAVGGRTSDFTLSLMRGGVYQVTAYGTEESFEHGSNSVVLRLNQGEQISLRLTQGRIYEHPDDEAYTTFSGFLI